MTEATRGTRSPKWPRGRADYPRHLGSPPPTPNGASTVRAVLFLAAVLIATVAYSIAVNKTASGYTLTGYVLGHTEVTYSCGSPVLQAAVQEWASVSGLTDGGCSATPDITLTILPDALLPYPLAGYGGAGGVWLAERTQNHYGVMLHEVGHALGLGHSAESLTAEYRFRSAAMFFLCCNPIAPDDIAGIQALYGAEPTPTPLFRVSLPLVGTD